MLLLMIRPARPTVAEVPLADVSSGGSDNRRSDMAKRRSDTDEDDGSQEGGLFAFMAANWLLHVLELPSHFPNIVASTSGDFKEAAAHVEQELGVTGRLIVKLHETLVVDLPGDDIDARALLFVARMVGLEDEIRSIISGLDSDAST